MIRSEGGFGVYIDVNVELNIENCFIRFGWSILKVYVSCFCNDKYIVYELEFCKKKLCYYKEWIIKLRLLEL